MSGGNPDTFNLFVLVAPHWFSLLQILDLSSNRLTVLPNLMLRPLVVIETLYLEHNKVGESKHFYFTISQLVHPNAQWLLPSGHNDAPRLVQPKGGRAVPLPL